MGRRGRAVPQRRPGTAVTCSTCGRKLNAQPGTGWGRWHVRRHKRPDDTDRWCIGHRLTDHTPIRTDTEEA